MDNLILSKYTKIFESLTLEIKLELLTRLTESIKNSLGNNELEKSTLLEEVSGSWKDVDDDVINKILDSRSTSSRSFWKRKSSFKTAWTSNSRL